MERRDFINASGIAAAGMLFGKTVFGFPDSKSLQRLIELDSGDEIIWNEIRKFFLYPENLCYLNTAGNGALPEKIVKKLNEAFLDDASHPGPGVGAEKWARVRRKCSELIGNNIDLNEIALVSTATEGINIIINGLPLRKGDQVIISSHEHPAVVVPLLNRMKSDGIEIKVFEPDLKDTVSNVAKIEALISKKTRLIFVSHLTFATGQIFPIREIGKLAKENNIWFAVDGAQAVGNVFEDIEDCNVDFYTFSGYKWLLGPKRTGVFYINKKMLEICKAITVGGGSYEKYDLSEKELILNNSAERYEYGTRNYALFHGLAESIDFLNDIGLSRISKHNKTLAEKFVEGIGRIKGINIVSPEEKEYRSPLISFAIEGKESMDVYYYLITKKKIRVRPVFENGLNFVRASFHIYNNEEDVEKLLMELNNLN